MFSAWSFHFDAGIQNGLVAHFLAFRVFDGLVINNLQIALDSFQPSPFNLHVSFFLHDCSFVPVVVPRCCFPA